MEDVLDLHEQPYDPKRPVMCFDESPKQLIAEVREPIPVAPARYDTGYERKGICDLMMTCEPKQGFRHMEISDKPTQIEFSHSMKQIADAQLGTKTGVSLVPKHGSWLYSAEIELALLSNRCLSQRIPGQNT